MASTDDEIPALTLEWSDAALAALKHVPFTVRKSAVRSVETYAMAKGISTVTPEVMGASRAAREKGEHPDQQKGAAGGARTLDRENEPPRQFVNFMFLRVDPAWRRLPDEQRAKDKADFAEVYKQHAKDGKIILRSYSTMATRADCEIMLWRISYEMDALQLMAGQLLKTGVGRWCTTPHNFLSMTKRSQYEDKVHEEHEEARLRIVPGRAKYIFVYPFVKTRDWYLMHAHVRQGVMDEHIQVGNKYARVKINTTYSFGLDDQDFVVAFESNYPEDFLDLVQDLRETESSKYTVRDTPIFTCVQRPIDEVLDLLG